MYFAQSDIAVLSDKTTGDGQKNELNTVTFAFQSDKQPGGTFLIQSTIANKCKNHLCRQMKTEYFVFVGGKF